MTADAAPIDSASATPDPAPLAEQTALSSDPRAALPSVFDWLRVAFVSTACALVVVVAYHMFIRGQIQPPIATIDLQSVVDAKELQFTEIVTRPGATDADRDRAYQLVSTLGGELESAVRDIRAECGCTLLVRAAVVGSAHADLTPALRARLGIADIDVASLREKLRQTRMTPSSGAAATPSQSLSDILGAVNGRPPR